jgi:DNA polymerase
MGVDPPLKISKTTGKETYALAKNDTAFMELAGHEDVIIQQLCSVRLGTKSTLEESRIERFIDISKRNNGKLPIPLKYYGAHTGRWSGSDKVNLQNLPSRDKKKKALKNAILAPEGHLLINCDSSQIEARVLAWLAGQDNLVDAFANKRDVYCEFASKVYDRPITKDNPIERFVGKTCILGLGYGTGALKLQHTLKTTPPYADIPLDRCEEIVKIYRANNNRIIELWREGDFVIKTMANWDNEYKPFPYGNNEVLWVHNNGIKLPNGLFINYPNLGLTEERNNAYEYKSRKGPVSLWGGSVVENVVQALARIVIGEQMLLIKDNYPIALTVHDAVVCIVKEDEIDKAMQSIVEVMSTPPDWAKTLPIACEAKYGKTYGDC